MSNLAQLLANVAADLKDAANIAWSAEELTRAVRWALYELSWAAPRRTSALLAVQKGVREYSLAAAGVTDLLYPTEVWCPAGDGEDACPPPSVAWRLLDDDTLYLASGYVPGGGQARLFYARRHALQGLDGATATTLTAEQEELVCLGAAGHAALQRAQEAIGLVNVTAQAPHLWRDWGERRLAAFRERLGQLGRREMETSCSWVGWG